MMKRDMRATLLAGILGLLPAAAAPAAEHDHHGASQAVPAPSGPLDQRRALALEPRERAMLLQEMRLFLRGIQQMTQALAQDDMAAVAKAARAMGRQATHDMPPSLMGKLPAEFRQLGFSVHSDFDQIALDAESLADGRHTLRQLGGTLSKCVACHEAYQIGAPVLAPLGGKR